MKFDESNSSQVEQLPIDVGDKRGTPGDIGVPDCKTDNGENARMHETNMHAK